MSRPVDALKTGLAKFYKSEKFSNFTIICGPYHFEVHKVSIVCSQSEYFHTACQAGRVKEGSTGVIELKAVDDTNTVDDACDDPEIVKLMMDFFYRCDYDAKVVKTKIEEPAAPVETSPTNPALQEAAAVAADDSLEQQGWDYRPRGARKTKKVYRHGYPDPLSSAEDMAFHAKLFALAVKYHVPALRDLATKKFREVVEEHCDGDAFAPAVAPAAHITFTSTPDDVHQLRDIVVETIHANSRLLNNEAVETVLHSTSELAYKVLMLTMNAGVTDGYTKCWEE